MTPSFRRPPVFAALLGSCLVLALVAPAQAQTILVVDHDGHGSAVSCADPAPVFTTIAAAIAAAAAGNIVRVCPGTYVENLNFGGKAITVRSTDGPVVTIIDGGATDSVVTFASGEGLTSVLEGFTIRNGRSGFGTSGSGFGGGIRIQGASPTIRGNRVVENRACDGLGISVQVGSPVIEENTIADNIREGCTGGAGGGGILVSGASTAQIRANRIMNNVMTSGVGGGVSLFAAGSPTIERNVISGNSVSGGIPCSQGGGIWMANQSDATIVGNLIVGNRAGCGGGIFWLLPSSSPLVANNTLADNDAAEGSGIFTDGFDATAVIVNNIVVAAPGQTAIFCGDFNDLNPPVLRFNNVFSASGAPYGGACADRTGVDGNISADPQFVDAGSGDYHLLAASPAVDAGDNTAALPAIDLDGDARVLDGDGDGVAVVDIGADESAVVAGPRGVIAGTVTDVGTGLGLGGVTVQVYSSTGVLTKSTLTASNGIFTVSGLLSGTYYARTFTSPAQNYVNALYDGIPCVACSVTLGTPIPVTAGTTTSGVDFALAQGGAISGTVTEANSGTPLTAVTVLIYTAAGTLAKTATTLSGSYSVTGLAAGTYHARTVVPALQNIIPSLQNYVDEVFDDIPCLGCAATAGTAIVVAAGATRSGVNFALSHGGVMTGMVTDAETSTGLAGVTVGVYSSTGSLAKSVLTPSGGFYTVDGLPSGTYYARTFVPSSLPFANELYDNIPCPNCTVTSGTPIVVTAGTQAGGIDFALLRVATPVVAGRVAAFALANAADARWMSTELVGGRSFCAQLAPGRAAVDRATPTVSVAVYRPHVTISLGSSATRVCFVAPETESALMKVTQADTSPRLHRLSVVETTLWANWFFIDPNYWSYTLLRNTTGAVINATITWRDETGATVSTRSATMPPNAGVFYVAHVTTGRIFGSVEVAHDGEPQGLVGSQTTLSPLTGLSFDTVLMQRR